MRTHILIILFITTVVAFGDFSEGPFHPAEIGRDLTEELKGRGQFPLKAEAKYCGDSCPFYLATLRYEKGSEHGHGI